MLPSFLDTQKAPNRASRLLMVAVLALTVSACGFHLRGNIPLSDGIKNMYVSAPDGSFKDLLEDRLTKLGATLAATPQAADVVLRVTSAQSSRTVGTLDERGKVNSYNVIFRVKYKLQDLAGGNVRPPATIRESRRYDFIPDQVVQSESEEAELIEDMEEEAVLKVIRKLASITDFEPSKVKQPVKSTPAASN